MADEPEKTPIRNTYAQRFADDLEANRKEQADVTEQMTGLQARLDQLRLDEAWLTQAQGSLPAVADPSVPDAGASAAAEGDQPEAPASAAGDVSRAVPAPRQDQPVEAAQPKRAAKKTAAAKGKDPAKKSTAKKTTAVKTTAKKTAAKKTAAAKAPAEEVLAEEAPAKEAAAKERTGPPLHELILAILLKSPGEPRVAREVTDQLAQDHPDRATSIQTVRNNLENLVRKNAAEKLHQQRSAMYIANATTEDEAAADTAGAAEDEPSPEPAEKVPAEV
ncbi:hypothetical protein ABZW47_30980 [Streptomyces sp. NPDC004549]|uniref:hypothetical protein n=1 Tax=Streptomyces sp. NPDC004549 TaxID=3154283 RepID=UPI0033B53188